MVYGKRRRSRRRSKRRRRSRRRSRKRAKKRQQLLSVSTVEKIAKKVHHKEAETFHLFQEFTAAQGYPNTATQLTDGLTILHRGGCTDLQLNLLQHWGPQIKLEDQYALATSFGNGFRKGEHVYLKGIQVKGYINIEAATMPVGPVIQFWLLSHAHSDQHLLI